jgi:hypothetical protein
MSTISYPQFELNGYSKIPRSKPMRARLKYFLLLLVPVIFVLLVIFFAAPKANDGTNCLCGDTMSHLINLASSAYKNNNNSFGTSLVSEIKYLNQLGTVYNFTNASSKNVDDVSVLVGGFKHDSLRADWIIFAVLGTDSVCYELAINKGDTALWNRPASPTLYGTYKSHGNCAATAVAPNYVSANNFVVIH